MTINFWHTLGGGPAVVRKIFFSCLCSTPLGFQCNFSNSHQMFTWPWIPGHYLYQLVIFVATRGPTLLFLVCTLWSTWTSTYVECCSCVKAGCTFRITMKANLVGRVSVFIVGENCGSSNLSWVPGGRLAPRATGKDPFLHSQFGDGISDDIKILWALRCIPSISIAKVDYFDVEIC